MKAKTLHVRFKTLKAFMDEGRQAAKSKAVLVDGDNEVFFSNIQTFESFLTGQKLHILSAIRARQPDSIYSLAKMVDRDFANVSRDCSGLEQKGFLTLDDSGDGRGSKVPRLTFDYHVIQVHLPTDLVYSHTLAA